MNNPFLKDGYLLPKVSINSLYIDKIGTKEINNFAGNLFSSAVFSNKIKLFLSQNNLPVEDEINTFKITLHNPLLNKQAEGILKEMGYTLAYILLALKTSSDFWDSIKKVYLCGGFMQDEIGEKILEYANEFFKSFGMTPYNILIADNGRYLPLLGAVKYANEKSSIAFDFGHSFVKRCSYSCSNNKAFVKMLPSVKSMYLEPEASPALLHNHIKEVVIQTISSCTKDISHNIGLIPISIANYVYKGTLNSERGSYAKLSAYTGNKRYDKVLSSEISQSLGYNVDIILLHDGSSGAYTINEENSVVLSLGTSIGVGFTNENFDFTFEV